jgi:peptidoglycan/LPS O-acetylase OafA/YrhL
MSENSPTSMALRLPALDALRAVGVAFVVAVHVGVQTGFTFNGGILGHVMARLDSGVAIFFALSGFLLFRPFAAAAAVGSRQRDFGHYLWRRAVRILPALWLMVVVVLSTLPEDSGLSAKIWVRYLTLTQTFFFDGGFDAGLNQLWSLAVESVFYLALPLIVVVAVTRTWRPVRTLVVTLGLTAAATFVWFEYRATQLVGDNPQGYRLPSFAIWFGVGMALATIHVALRTRTAPRSWRVFDDLGSAPLACWGAAVALIVFISTPIGGPLDLAPVSMQSLITKQIVYALIAALLLIPAAFGPPNQFKAALSTRPLRWLGTVSYGVFLWHLWVLLELYRVQHRPAFTGDMLSTYVATFAVTLVVASISWYCLERPLLTLTARPRGGRRLSDDREPQRAHAQEPGQLRPDPSMLVVPRMADPAPNGQQRDGNPQLYRT